MRLSERQASSRSGRRSPSESQRLSAIIDRKRRSKNHRRACGLKVGGCRPGEAISERQRRAAVQGTDFGRSIRLLQPRHVMPDLVPGIHAHQPSRTSRVVCSGAACGRMLRIHLGTAGTSPATTSKGGAQLGFARPCLLVLVFGTVEVAVGGALLEIGAAERRVERHVVRPFGLFNAAFQVF